MDKRYYVAYCRLSIRYYLLFFIYYLYGLNRVDKSLFLQKFIPSCLLCKHFMIVGASASWVCGVAGKRNGEEVCSFFDYKLFCCFSLTGAEALTCGIFYDNIKQKKLKERI